MERKEVEGNINKQLEILTRFHGHINFVMDGGGKRAADLIKKLCDAVDENDLTVKDVGVAKTCLEVTIADVSDEKDVERAPPEPARSSRSPQPRKSFFGFLAQPPEPIQHVQPTIPKPRQSQSLFDTMLGILYGPFDNRLPKPPKAAVFPNVMDVPKRNGEIIANVFLLVEYYESLLAQRPPNIVMQGNTVTNALPPQARVTGVPASQYRSPSPDMEDIDMEIKVRNLPDPPSNKKRKIGAASRTPRCRCSVGHCIDCSCKKNVGSCGEDCGCYYKPSGWCHLNAF